MRIAIHHSELKIPHIEYLKIYEYTKQCVRYSAKAKFFVNGLLLESNHGDIAINDTLSLTEAISPESQIRYLLKEEYEKYAVLFLKESLTSLLPLTICYQSLPTVTPTIELQSRGLGLTAQIEQSNDKELFSPLSQLSPYLLLEKSELDNNDIIQLEILGDRALKFGNADAALMFLHRAEERGITKKIASRLAHAYTMLGITERAEWYYNFWRRHGDSRDKAWANYSLSMLYLRHHPPRFHNAHYARELLDEAYEAIATYGHREEAAFDKIFNRNGYALILFRSGKIDEAIELLTHGIDYLLANASEKALMHASVLLFNLYQCHAALESHDVAENVLKQLIKIDANHVEYHIMLGEFLLRHEAYADAQEIFAGILNHSMLYPEIVNSYILTCLKAHHDVTTALAQFWQSYPQESHILYLLEILSEHADTETIAKNFTSLALYINNKNLSAGFHEEVSVFQAEQLLKTVDVNTAIAFLEANKKWDAGLISQNLAMLEGRA